MKSFFTSLLYAAVAGGLSVAIAGKAYEKHLRYLVALLCTAIIVSPLISLVVNTELDLPEREDAVSVDAEAAARLIAAQTAEDMEKAAADYIFSKTGIKTRAVSIQIESKEDTLSLATVKARVSYEAELDAVKTCLAELFNDVPIEVETDEQNATSKAA